MIISLMSWLNKLQTELKDNKDSDKPIFGVYFIHLLEHLMKVIN